MQHCTCGTLLELLIFLFPPLPGLEDAPQGGQLAVTSDRWSVDPGHQATGPQHPLLVHQLYYSDRGGKEAQRSIEGCCRRMKWGNERVGEGVEGSKAGKQGKDGGRGGRECVAVWMWDEAKNHQMCKSR